MKSTILKILWEIIKAIFIKKEPTERQKTKKRIKELEREIKSVKKHISKAINDNDHSRYDFWYDKLQRLKAQRKELRDLLCK